MLVIVCDDNFATVAVIGEGGAGDMAAVLFHIVVADDQIVGVDGINTVVVFVGEGDDRPTLARFSLAGPGEVPTLLGLLAGLSPEGRG